MRLGFLCTVPSEQGGATPICNSELVYQQIPDAIRDRFERDGVMYVRNYSDIDVHWNDVFQTEERDEVEQFCQANQISHEWLDGNRLRTRQINQASIRHPVTGAQVWFNQAHLFHVSNLDKELQRNLLATVEEADLPRNTYYGDGAPIATSDLALIRNIYQRHAIRFDWQRNDLLLLDNMLYSHCRDSFVGDRQVLVGMARSIDADSGESRP
jgi:alpha-ketoglutarate-dependent taurine dioxygenase